MGAVAVLYTLTTGGDLKRDLPNLATGLDKVAAGARAARDQVLELGSRGNERLGQLKERALAGAEGAKAIAEGFKKAMEAVHGLLSANDEYAQSTVRLGNELDNLKTKLADAIGPTVAGWVDSFTVGLVYLATLVSGTVRPAFETLAKVVSGFFEAATKGFEVWGKLARGDFAGARQAIAEQRSQLEGLLDTLKTGWEDVQEANKAAIEEARKAWEKQVDGVRDLTKDERDKAFEAFKGTPGGQTLTAIEAARQSGRTSDFFSSGESLDELQAGFDLWVFWQNEVVGALQEAADKTQVASDELQQSLKDLASGMRGSSTGLLQGFNTGMAALNTGSISGVLSTAGAGDPLTMAIMGAIDLIKDPSTLVGLFTEVLETYMDLDQWVVDFAETASTEIIAALPDLIAGFATIGPALAVALVESAPVLFESLIAALRELPFAFAQALLDILPNFGNLKETVGDAFSVGGKFATYAGVGGTRILGVKIPTFHEGGVMPHDGLANLERGERVLTREEARNYHSQMGGFHFYGIQDLRQLSEQVQAAVGPYGLNLSLTPRAG